MSVLSAGRHAEVTRGAIVDAAVELLLERRSDGFSVQEVADRAGLTHRTVYRYFPTRQELIAATARSLGAGFADDSFGDVSTVEEWLRAVGPHLARTEANFEIARSILAAVLASDDLVNLGPDVRDGDTHRWNVFRSEFSRLPEGEARRTFASLRHLTSSAAYVLFRLRFGMSADEAVETIRTGASQIVEQARRRDRAAAPRSHGDE